MKEKKRNEELLDIINELNKVDPIDEFESYSSIVTKNMEILCDGYWLSGYGTESYYYGHINALYDYVGLSGMEDVTSLPAIVHGTYFEGEVEEDVAINHCLYPSFVFQSDIFKEYIHKLDKNKLVFSIGPYIHYAKQVYDDAKILTLKKQFGRTLLVFPGHSTEDFNNSDLNSDSYVDLIMNNLAQDFDSVIVCIYWLDLDCDYVKEFASRGAKIVTAGIRGDSNFLSRLKTLITISDSTSGNCLGTHIGYASHMGKPFYFIADKRPTKKIFLRGNELYDRFTMAFDGSEEMKSQREYLVKRYWGEGKEKTTEEMMAIINISNTLKKITRGNMHRNSKGIKEMMEKYDRESNEYKELVEALS